MNIGMSFFGPHVSGEVKQRVPIDGDFCKRIFLAQVTREDGHLKSFQFLYAVRLQLALLRAYRGDNSDTSTAQLPSQFAP